MAASVVAGPEGGGPFSNGRGGSLSGSPTALLPVQAGPV